MTYTHQNRGVLDVIPPAGTVIPPDGYHAPVLAPEQVRTQKNANMQAGALAYRTSTAVDICGDTVDIRAMPDYRQNYLRRLSAIGTSPTKAIKLMCFQCSGYSSEEQSKCTNRECPLYVLRWNRAHRVESNMEEDDADNDD